MDSIHATTTPKVTSLLAIRQTQRVIPKTACIAPKTTFIEEVEVKLLAEGTLILRFAEIPRPMSVVQLSEEELFRLKMMSVAFDWSVGTLKVMRSLLNHEGLFQRSYCFVSPPLVLKTTFIEVSVVLKVTS